MKDIGWMALGKEGEDICGLMESNILEIGKKIKWMAGEILLRFKAMKFLAYLRMIKELSEILKIKNQFFYYKIFY